ncbi:prepilin-type N-terminal cleavage/methylation domain-containing protein [Shewanella aestuarii]|uniref:Prepilin-type N-terminal cleavage/methylation domain-containing protein n=1 Tax=Shewanella aestuarii TaxID=1028752 RepID=A0A6G9QHK0_9GAMM|nr:prepilin-type N-terminal cleavage/methylation domain-containing protein [Shewanella aestuarii]QIR13371.1 prepilin-type N-terminal cleavage/methylation domain-containing protein [Shewanella aestuarii]
MKSCHSTQMQNGFSLVELVTTILLIGILAVTVLPRLFSDSSYSAYALRNEFIAELRQGQLRALNNTDRCYDINVTVAGYQLRHYSARNGNACSGTLLRTELLQEFQGGAYVSLLAGGSQNFTVTFDSLGRLLQPICSGACFNIIADDTLVVAVESEGYIHAM